MIERPRKPDLVKWLNMAWFGGVGVYHFTSSKSSRSLSFCFVVFFSWIVSNDPILLTIQMSMFWGLTFLIVWYKIYACNYLFRPVSRFWGSLGNKPSSPLYFPGSLSPGFRETALVVEYVSTQFLAISHDQGWLCDVFSYLVWHFLYPRTYY